LNTSAFSVFLKFALVFECEFIEGTNKIKKKKMISNSEQFFCISNQIPTKFI